MTRTVRYGLAGRPPPAPGPGVDLTGGWAPHAWLGAPAPGGLALPAVTPTRAWMYSPRGVWLDDERVIVADTGNHRLLIWHGVPDRDGAPADVVLGQPDATTEGRAAGGRGPENGLHLPTGILVHDGKLVVADAWHHRILVWDAVPATDDVAPDLVLGQDDLSSVEPNPGRECSAATLYWPFGIAVVGGRFWVADTGNNRVLLWDGVPADGRGADAVLGQPTFAANGENRRARVEHDTLCWPYGLSLHSDPQRGDLLAVADSGNNRVMVWRRSV